MNSTLDLSTTRFAELDAAEMSAIDGGLDWKSFAKKAGLIGVAVWVVDNWQDIEEGFMDNYDPR